MYDFEFFTGDRKVDQFTLSLHKGKAQVSCTVLERWEERTSRSLNCGMRRKRTLKKSIGVSAVEREELESTISGSFGLEGIAGFKSELRGKLSREITFEESREEEEEFEFAAPKCGRLIVRVYQLVRIYQLSFKDFRSWLFRKGDLFKTIVESVDRIYDRSIEIENDPDCGCNRKPELGFDGLVNLDLGKIAMLVGYQHKNNGIALPTLGVTLQASNIKEILFHSITLSSEAIPSHLLFLADESSSVLTGEFLPVSVRSAVRKSRKRSRLDKLGLYLLGAGIGVAWALLSQERRPKSKRGLASPPKTETKVEREVLVERMESRSGTQLSAAVDQAYYETDGE
jgi:hypothetical protein